MGDPRFSLGDFRLHLDPEIEAQIELIQRGRLRGIMLQPNWSQFQKSDLDRMLQQPLPPAPPPAFPRGAGPATPRAAQVGDLLGAVWRLPFMQQAATRLADDASRRFQRDWGQATTGERALVITQAIVVGGGALTGVLTNSPTRVQVLNFLSGKDIPVPGLPGLSVQLRHNSTLGDYGGILMFDLAPYMFR
ncbi:MAG: hypothetical protein ACOY7J_03125 [Pseudomonadota bacterium]